MRGALSSALLQLVLGSFLISFSAVFVRLVHVGPTASGFYRNLFGAAVLVLLALWRREALWKGVRPAALALLASAFFATDLFFWHRSILIVGPGLATILGNFQVFFMALAGMLLFRERPGWRFLLSIPLAILGLFLLVGLSWPALDSRYRIGVGLGLMTALMYTGYLLTLRGALRRRRRLGGAANLAWISAGTAAILALASVAEGRGLGVPDARSWIVLVAYGVVCQALGWVVISSALPQVDASRAGLILLLQPTLTFVWDIVLFRRPTSTTEALGALLALGAIYLGTAARATSSQPRPVDPT